MYILISTIYVTEATHANVNYVAVFLVPLIGVNVIVIVLKLAFG
jgi:hypothetical protein